MAILIPTGIDSVTGQFKVFDPATDTVLTPLGFVRVLGTATGIDGTTTGTTTIYTSPSDKEVITVGVILRVVSVSGFVSVGTAGVGIASGEDDIFPPAALTGLDAAGKCYRFSDDALVFKKASFNEVIKLGIDVAFNATSLILEADLIGYYKV